MYDACRFFDLFRSGGMRWRRYPQNFREFVADGWKISRSRGRDSLFLAVVKVNGLIIKFIYVEVITCRISLKLFPFVYSRPRPGQIEFGEAKRINRFLLLFLVTFSQSYTPRLIFLLMSFTINVPTCFLSYSYHIHRNVTLLE